MPSAVRFDEYGDLDVLRVVEVPRPVPGPRQALVRLKAAGINPGEGKIREGLMHEVFPATFPSGEGSDLAGVIEEVGEAVEGLAVGDEVLGFSDARASHAELALVEANNVTPRPESVPWEVAGSLFVAGSTAYAAVRAVSAGTGDTVVVAGAAGGVGVIAVQLALDLGVKPERIDTIVNFAAKAAHGVKTEASRDAASAEVLAELAALVADRHLEIPIARVFPLAEVKEAFRELEQGHTHGKIVLRP